MSKEEGEHGEHGDKKEHREQGEYGEHRKHEIKGEHEEQREQRSVSQPNQSTIQQAGSQNYSGNNSSSNVGSSTGTSNSQSDIPERAGLQQEPQTEEHEKKEEIHTNSKFTEICITYSRNILSDWFFTVDCQRPSFF